MVVLLGVRMVVVRLVLVLGLQRVLGLRRGLGGLDGQAAGRTGAGVEGWRCGGRAAGDGDGRGRLKLTCIGGAQGSSP